MTYSEVFKDHLANPRGAGEIPNADVVVEQTNPICGDSLRLSLKLRGDRIEQARFLAYGCAPTLACGSVLTEILEGMSKADAVRLTRQDIIQKLGGLPARKRHAPALAIETLRAAIELLDRKVD